jgi:hypothetical protein
MDLDVLPGHFALCRLPASAAIPPWTEAAQANIAVFAIATHDTDYLLLRESDLPSAVTALERAGHRVHALKE